MPQIWAWDSSELVCLLRYTAVLVWPFMPRLRTYKVWLLGVIFSCIKFAGNNTKYLNLQSGIKGSARTLTDIRLFFQMKLKLLYKVAFFLGCST